MKKKEIIETTANSIMIGVQANKYHTNVYDTKSNDFNHSHLVQSAHIAYNKCVKKAMEFLLEHEPDEFVDKLGTVGHFFNKKKFCETFIKEMEK